MKKILEKPDGALERTRTSDPQLTKLMLYPLSYERRLGRIPESQIPVGTQ